MTETELVASEKEKQLSEKKKKTKEAKQVAESIYPISSEGTIELALSEIIIEGNNPRQQYTSEGLKKLATSIKETGLLQPLIVRTKPNDNKYYLVAGERRYRAAKLIRRKIVPCIVHEDLSDAQTIYIQHIENAHREDLNPIEYAQSIANLIGQTIEINKKGKRQTIQVNAKTAAMVYALSQSTVSQYLALLKLPRAMQEAIRNGKMTFAQARELCSPKLTDKEREKLFQGIESGEIKRASDVKEAIEKSQTQKALQSGAKKSRGRPTQTNDDTPGVRQNMDTALARLQTVKIKTRRNSELREGLATSYSRHVKAKSEEKKHFYKGFAAGLEWASGIREKI